MYEIVKHPFIGTSEQMRMELRKYGTAREVFQSYRAEAAKRITTEGLAISFYLDFALKIDPYVATGQIVPIPIEENLEVNLSLLRAKNKLSPAFEAFKKELMLQVNHLNRLKSLG